ncbi:MAG: hypothetical protein ACJ71O_14995 [Nitrososphaeraceae archaeon]
MQTKSFTVKYYTIVSLSPDNAKIYVANTLSNDIYTIDGTNNSAVASIPVGTHPYGVVYNPDNHDIYIATTTRTLYVSFIPIITTRDFRIISQQG